MFEEKFDNEEEEQVVDEEYKIWKKNCPYLYDVLVTQGLEWPSLTVNWLPTIDIPTKSYLSVQKMVIGTITSGNEQDYLMIAKARLPVNENTMSDVHETNKDLITAFSKLENKIEIETKINHQGEVNKARVMPQANKYNIIATKTPSGEVHIFDYFKHPPKPIDNTVKAEIKLQGHTKEGYGLSWSPVTEGYLVSGSNDQLICIWDTKKETSEAMKVYSEHTAEVEDVNWNKKLDNVFASVGDDKSLKLWDIRQEKSVCSVVAHSQEVYSVDFNPVNELLLITASKDRSCALWDIRNLQVKLHSFVHHKDEVICAKWNPKQPTLFASCSSDRRILIWDVSKIGGTIGCEDTEDGPSELIFTHGGHTAKISEVDWNPNDELMCSSIAEDNIIHLWKMNQSIYYTDTT